jgi:hypothetical protein
MTRPFRLMEDERRYFALRSEMYIRLCRSTLPAQTIHDIMRTFGKLEDMMLYEGVRQGFAAAHLAPDTGTDDADPLVAHFSLYQDASTPLTRCEDRFVVAGEDRHPFIGREPMRFAPLTLTEAAEQYGPDLTVNPPNIVAQTSPQDSNSPKAAPDTTTESFDEFLDRLAAGVTIQPLEEIAAQDTTPTRPDVIDRARDVLLSLTSKPPTWQEMILLLMRELRMDAGFLDELMSSPMGMTAISQAGLLHLHPGEMPEIVAPTSTTE